MKKKDEWDLTPKKLFCCKGHHQYTKGRRKKYERTVTKCYRGDLRQSQRKPKAPGLQSAVLKNRGRTKT